MSKKLKILISILVVITFISTWAFFVSKKMTKNIVKPPETQSINDENANVQELILTESKDGKKYWELYAKSGDYDSITNQVHLKSVNGNLYKNDRVVLSFAAPSAIYYDKKKEIKLYGGSRAATSNNILITANELYWKSKDDIMIATENVKIRKSSDLLVTGDKAIFSTMTNKIKMIGKVKSMLIKGNN
jgi:LPS export ABC transporter protein LptC